MLIELMIELSMILRFLVEVIDVIYDNLVSNPIMIILYLSKII